MTASPFARTRALLVASIASLVAILALAAPVSAHHRSHHHHSSDRNGAAGKIASFDPSSGKLTIALFGGDLVSGVVTDETRIEYAHDCRKGSSHGWSRAKPGHRRHFHHSSDWGDWGHDGDNDGLTSAALVEGTVVDEADLELQDGIASFEKIELVK